MSNRLQLFRLQSTRQQSTRLLVNTSTTQIRPNLT